MIEVRPSEARGPADHGWLQSRHSFSFAGYYDPQYMGVSALRVINDDKVAAGAGFATHSHQDMEIISYVKKGRIEHKDSMGNVEQLPPGEFQLMTAGTGVTHSEYNPSTTDALEFLQIWIQPNQLGIEPGYQQKRFEPSIGIAIDRLAGCARRLVAAAPGCEPLPVVAATGRDGDAYACGAPIGLCTRGFGDVVKVNGEQLSEGDGATISDTDSIEFEALSSQARRCFSTCLNSHISPNSRTIAEASDRRHAGSEPRKAIEGRPQPPCSGAADALKRPLTCCTARPA